MRAGMLWRWVGGGGEGVCGWMARCGLVGSERESARERERERERFCLLGEVYATATRVSNDAVGLTLLFGGFEV